MTIQDLKKGDTFLFNSYSHFVTRKYVNDDKPLLAIRSDDGDTHYFHNEELEVIKLDKAE